MAQPTPYNKTVNFAQEESNSVSGRSTLRNASVDAELSAIETTLDQTLVNLALLQRDDGQLRDGTVALHTLGSSVVALLAAGQGVPRGAWVTATAYALRDLVSVGGSIYICTTAHTSAAAFATDLAAARWMVFGSASSQFDQLTTGGFFQQNGARVNRINDRLLIAGATLNDALFPNVAQDWFTQYQVSKGLAAGAVVSSLLAVANDGNTSETGAVALLGAIQSKNFASAGTSAIASSAYVVNNHATLTPNAWAFYGEAHKTTACGSIYGLELDTYTLVATIEPTPWQQGDVICIQLASGAELSATGQFDASAAIQIAANPKKFKAGINFMNDSLSTNFAIKLAGASVGHSISWFNSSGSVVGSIASTNTNSANATGINFNTVGMQVVGAAAQTLAYFVHIASATNYLQFSAATATNPPTIEANGSDANIDLSFLTKGTGLLRFGAYTAGVVSQAGYVQIRDSGGTIRRLLVG